MARHLRRERSTSRFLWQLPAVSRISASWSTRFFPYIHKLNNGIIHDEIRRSRSNKEVHGTVGLAAALCFMRRPHRLRWFRRRRGVLAGRRLNIGWLLIALIVGHRNSTQQLSNYRIQLTDLLPTEFFFNFSCPCRKTKLRTLVS